MVLQVEIHRLRKQIDRAVELIHQSGCQADECSSPTHRISTDWPVSRKRWNDSRLPSDFLPTTCREVGRCAWGSLPLALALSCTRRDRVKDALDICEPLWTSVREVDALGITCINVLFGSNDHPHTPEPAQIDRVAGWFDRAVAQQANQQRPNIGLFVAFGNLREKQQNYVEAEKWYLRTIQGGDRSGLALNNLAWLMAHYDGKVKEALVYANRAIDLRRDHPDFLDTRGVIYLLDRQPERAIEDLERAVSGDPSSPSKHFHLALAFLANNDRKKAKESWETAKAKGFTQNSLDAFEEPSHQNLVKELGLP